MAIVIDGKKVASQVEAELQEKIHSFQEKPTLAVLLVGQNPASLAYIRMKRKRAAAIGMQFILKEYPLTINEETVLKEINLLNNNSSVHGILVQLPLPDHISTRKILNAIDPSKDVDCFHPLNIGKLAIGEEDGFKPCTPLGIQYLLQSLKLHTEGKHIVIVGRSNIVGKPLALLLMQKAPFANATVTVAHSYTKNLQEVCLFADILIVAMGSPLMIKKEMVKQDAIVIDVGVHKIQTAHGFKIVGDVDFEDVKEKCSYISPVPGGVGPMTIAMLLKNTFESFLSLQGSKS